MDIQVQSATVFRKQIGLISLLVGVYFAIVLMEVLFSLSVYFVFSADSPTQDMLHIGHIAAVGFYYSYLAGILVYIISGILFLVLMYRTARQAKAFSVPYTYCSPGMVVGYWFIPFINMIKPYRIMQELFRAVSLSIGRPDKNIRKNNALITVWWCMFLFGGLVSTAVSRMGPDHPKTLKDVANLELHLGVSAVLSVVTAMLFFMVLKRMRDLHAVALQHQQPPAAGEPATEPVSE